MLIIHNRSVSFAARIADKYSWHNGVAIVALAGSLALSASPTWADGGHAGIVVSSPSGAGGTDGTLAQATGKNGEFAPLASVGGAGGGGAVDLTTGNGAPGGAKGGGSFGAGVGQVYGAAGATGAAGLTLTTDTTLKTAVTGGTGGAGQPNVNNVNTTGGGGGGGVGVTTNEALTITATGSVTGGAGFGANNYAGGGGGAGIFSTGQVTVAAGGTVTGGAGGGALGASAGGGGGMGAILAAGGGLTNSGTITGGVGGAGRFTANLLDNTSGPRGGLGGEGVKGSDIILINAGSISGAMGGESTGTGAPPTVLANAVTFLGGVNTLEIWAGSVITGNVVAFSGADTLRLGGDADASFDVSEIGAAAQYRGFGIYEKAGRSTWTLEGTTSEITPWTLSGGTLSISSDENLGASSGTVTFNGGTLRNTESFASARDMTLNALGGTIETLADLTLSGGISGPGALTKTGNGTLTLSGTGSYAGETNVNGGALVQGAAGAFSSASAYAVANNALIDLGGYDTDMAGLSNSGTVNFGGSGGTTLNVAGNYVGNGGTLVINSVLGGDGSTTDLLKVGGDTSGNTNLKVINRDGLGAQTVNGIEVVDVGGQSNGTFSLLGDFVTKDGKQAVSGGAYAYTLQQGSGTGNEDGNWYLTSQLDNPGPGPDPRYSPSVPVYEGYLQNMQALNKLPTLQERVGERYWTGRNGDGQATGAAVDDKGVWARVEGAHNRLEPDTSLSRMKQDINTFIMQAGVDGQFYESDNGKLIAGITGQYGHAKGDISSFHGDGAISTDGWSLGATATWYGTSGFYVDGQAQVTWFDSDLNSWTANQGLADGRKATGYALSIEAGQRFAIDQNWSLTPQAQLMYSSINADSFRDAWDSRVSLHDGDSLIGRLGLAANYANSWQGKDGLTVNTTVYGIANLYQEMLSGSSVNVAGVAFDTDNDRTWGGIGAGGTYAWADNKYAVYGEGTINTALNHFADSYTLKGTVGFKVKW